MGDGSDYVQANFTTGAALTFANWGELPTREKPMSCPNPRYVPSIFPNMLK